MSEDLINGMAKSAKSDENDLVAFENDYRKMRTNMRGQVKKLEDESKKAGKKGPDVLKKVVLGNTHCQGYPKSERQNQRL